LLGSADYTSTSGTSVVLAQGASVSDLVVIVVYDVFSVADTVSKTSGGTFDSNVTFSAGLDVVNASDSTQMVVRGRSSDNFGIITFKNNADDTTKGQVKSDASSNLILRAGANNDALKIDTNGHVTMTRQPAFLAHPSSTITNISVGVNGLVFGGERFDQNADYNTSNGTFTAPVTGKYQLNVHFYMLNIDTGATYYEGLLLTSNKNYGVIVSPKFSADLDYYHMELVVLADMDSGDTATIRMDQSGGNSQTDISANALFSGYLVA